MGCHGCHASFLVVGGSFCYNDRPAWEVGTSTVRVVFKRVLLCLNLLMKLMSIKRFGVECVEIIPVDTRYFRNFCLILVRQVVFLCSRNPLI